MATWRCQSEPGNTGTAVQEPVEITHTFQSKFLISELLSVDTKHELAAASLKECDRYDM